LTIRSARWISRAAAVGLIAGAGCGSVSTAPDAVPSPDGAGACAPTAPFGTPAPMAEINTAGAEFNAWLSPDELTIYYGAVAPAGIGGQDIYVATRASRDAAFGAGVLLSGVNSADDEGKIALTADGLTAYLAVGQPGDLYTASRASVTAAFDALTPVAGLNTAENDAGPWISPDGRTIYFHSHRTRPVRIYRATRSTGPFGAPEPVGELFSNHGDGDPVVSADGLSIYFASGRPGDVPRWDVWVATRSSTSDGFGAPVAIDAVNEAGKITWPTWISPDNCRLYFSSDRTGGEGDYDLWVAERSP
jgi:dipeptidyl aminopeptidase/acylaminoacyl peptidase